MLTLFTRWELPATCHYALRLSFSYAMMIFITAAFRCRHYYGYAAADAIATLMLIWFSFSPIRRRYMPLMLRYFAITPHRSLR